MTGRTSTQSAEMDNSVQFCRQESCRNQEMLSPQGATKQESLMMLPHTKLQASKPLGDLLMQVHTQWWKVWILMPAGSVSSKKPNKTKELFLLKEN